MRSASQTSNGIDTGHGSDPDNLPDERFEDQKKAQMIYLCEMLQEFQQMAHEQRKETLAFLLGMAVLEARNQIDSLDFIAD